MFTLNNVKFDVKCSGLAGVRSPFLRRSDFKRGGKINGDEGHLVLNLTMNARNKRIRVNKSEWRKLLRSGIPLILWNVARYCCYFYLVFYLVSGRYLPCRLPYILVSYYLFHFCCYYLMSKIQNWRLIPLLAFLSGYHLYIWVKSLFKFKSLFVRLNAVL